MNSGITYEPPDPKFNETIPHQHLMEVLKPVLGPYLESIANVLHITECLGPMQQMTFNVTDECGFSGEIVLRVRETGRCFDDLRQRRDSSNSSSMEQREEGSNSYP